MVDRNPGNSLKKLNAAELRDALTSVTVGGSRGNVDLERKGFIFAEYIRRAFPTARVIDVQPIATRAALNSVSGIITIQFQKQETQTVFGKVHIESNTKSINVLGAEQEYENAEMLADAGWPVLKPISKSENFDYPLLLYPVIDAIPLFDKLEESYISGDVQITDEELAALALYNQVIGEQEVRKIRVGTREEATNSPVQTLLLKRFESDGRIDQWYTPQTVFTLPGLDKQITWNELLNKQWIIDGQEYQITLGQIVEQARKILAFDGEEQTYLTISHGDDHAGNVRLTNPPTVFDPAFAGWNPAALDVKALAHTGFLPMAGMYYPPKGLETNYQLSDESIIFTGNMENLPIFETQEMLAKQLIDFRILPLLKRIKDMGGDITKEKQRMQAGLAACALLTVNIAQLLEQDDGRAVGLLPMAIMFASLQGLPMLEYLKRKIEEL